MFSKDCPKEIAECIFQDHSFEYPKGLYNYAGKNVGERVNINGDFIFRPLFSGDNIIDGAEFCFTGLRFIIWFSENEMKEPFYKQFYHHMGGKLKNHKTTINFHVKW